MKNDKGNKRWQKAIMGILLVLTMLFSVVSMLTHSTTGKDVTQLTVRNCYIVNPDNVTISMDGNTTSVLIGHNVQFLSDGNNTYFNDTKTYTITVTDTTAGSEDSVDISVSGIKVVFDVPVSVTIGEKFTIRGVASAGDMVDIAVKGYVYPQLNDLVIDENGEFEKEIYTSTANITPFTIPGTVKLEGYVDRAAGADAIWENETANGVTTIRMVRKGLEVELSADIVVLGGNITISGTAEGSEAVNIIVIAPNGSSGMLIDGSSGKYFYNTTASVSENGTFSKNVAIGHNVDTGNYLVVVLSPGRDGVYGRLYTDVEHFVENLSAQYNLMDKTQEQLLIILVDATVDVAGSDDILWNGYLTVYQPKIIYVDDDFEDDPANHRWNTVQEGINDANDGDTVFVYSGTYYENVVVNKPITLQGEDRDNAIIDGGGNGDVVNVTADDCTISGFTVRNGNCGIMMYKSNNNTIMGNDAYSNNWDGIDLQWSNNNTITNNTANSNGVGIHSCHSNNNMISNNILNSNAVYGIKLTDSSNYNTVLGNAASSNDEIGITLGGGFSNNILDNTITNNDYGIYLTESRNNLIYHNNIINNTNQACDDETNSWDNGYPSGGNYWSDWASPDNYSGVHQNESGSDGIVDTPYLIPEGVNQDCYPFANSNEWMDTIPPVVTITSPVNGSIVTIKNVTVIGTATDDVGIVTMCYAHGSERRGGGRCGHLSNISTNVSINWTVYFTKKGTYTMTVRAVDEAGNSGSASVKVIYKEENITTFDTGPGSYPSISGTHNGTITPYHNLNVNKIYTYSCSGTGGHTEYIKIWNTSNWNVTATWNGYAGDWHNISFNESFTLQANERYNYTIITGSYPQIHHTDALPTANGWISCTQFTDVNGKIYHDWIPAVKLF